MTESKKIYILNLVDEMGSFLTSYFAQPQFVLLKRDEVENYEALDYIYCDSVASGIELAKDYDVVKNEIEIMSSKSLGDYRSFILNNGRIVIDKNVNESMANKWILDKFFSKETNIHLDEHFPNLELAEGVKITNHLLMGHFLDELSVNIFEKNFNLVPVRSFVDHTIYYYTYLRQAGLAGVPYEIEYGMNDEFLAINIHVSVKNFVAEYIMDSFGSVNSQDPLKYLLGVIARSCDFLDVSYIDNPNKLALVGIFYREKSRISQGIAFNHVKTSAQVVQNIENKIKQFRSTEERKNEQEQKQNKLANSKLPGGLAESSKPFDASSDLASDEELVSKIINFMVHNFEEHYPDNDLSDFTDYHFEEFAANFRPEDLIQRLSDDDKLNLIERIRKHNLVKAYSNELSRVRESIASDGEMISQVNQTMGDGLAEKLSEKFSLGDINKMLNANINAKDEEVVEGHPKMTVFGEFIPSVQSNDLGDSFESISNPFDDSVVPLGNLDITLETDTLAEIDSLVPNMEESTFSPDDNDLGATLVPDISSFISDDNQAIFGSALENSLQESVSGLIQSDNDSQKVNGKDQNPDEITSINGSFDEEEGVIKIGGGPDDPETATVVSGGKEAADDFMQKISGLSDDDKGLFMTSFSNSFETNVDNKNFIFSSGDKKDREHSLRRFVKSSLDEQAKLDPGLKAFLHKEAPKELDKGLRKYAASLEKNISELSDKELKDFQSGELPKIMGDLLLDDEKIKAFKNDLENYFVADTSETNLTKLQQKFKDKLEAKLSDLNGLSIENGNYIIDEGVTSQAEVQRVVKDVFKETFIEEMSIESLSPQEIKEKEALIVKDLSVMMGVSEEELKTVVGEVTKRALDKELELVQSKMGESSEDNGLSSETNETETVLLEKVKKLSDENQSLKTNISALQLQLDTEKLTSKTLKEVENQAASGIDDIVKASKEEGLTHVEKKHVMDELNTKEHLDPEFVNKVQKALDRESDLIEKVKASEVQYKKLLIEGEKKDSLFKAELAKAQRGMKAKEVVLDNAKESMKNLMEKKNKEIVGLKSNINELNQKLKDDKSEALTQQVKAVTKDNENLQRMVDIYRTKVDSLAKNMEAQKKSDSSDNLSEENRNLKRLKAQLENKFQAEVKLKKSIEERYQKSKEEEVKAKNEAVNSKAELKTLQSQIKLLKDQNTKLVQSVANASKKSVPEQSSKEVDQLTAKNKKLQEKLSDMTRKLQQYESSDVSSPKILEGAQESRDAFYEKKAAKELELVRSQNEQLQSKIQELVDKLKKADEAANASTRSGDDNKSPNEKRLEQSVKKMNSELSKARDEASEKKKEAIQYKAEVNKLKNKISMLEREAQKNKKKAA